MQTGLVVVEKVLLFELVTSLRSIFENPIIIFNFMR